MVMYLKSAKDRDNEWEASVPIAREGQRGRIRSITDVGLATESINRRRLCINLGSTDSTLKYVENCLQDSARDVEIIKM